MNLSKLTPEQEARVVMGMTCMTKVKEIDLNIMKAVLAQTESFMKGTPLDAKTAADHVTAAMDALGKLHDQLVLFRNSIEDRRTRGQIDYRKMQVRMHGDRDDHHLEARVRDPKALIKRMAESIAARREKEAGEAT